MILIDASYTRIGYAFTANTASRPFFGAQGLSGCDPRR